KFGVRDAHFEAATGFWLNGKNFKLKGVCVHHDGGAFGAAVPLAIWEDRLQTLKAMGANAIRTSHNPPAPEFLDLCDRLGFLVMAEAFDEWTFGKVPEGYHKYFAEWSERDVTDFVHRDRNHPSIVLWSAGNEIGESFDERYSLGPDSNVVRPNYTAGMVQVERLWKWITLHDYFAGNFMWTGIDYLGESTWPFKGFASGAMDVTGQPKDAYYLYQGLWTDRPVLHLFPHWNWAGRAG